MDKFFKTLHPYVKRADGHMFMVNQTRARIDDSTEAQWANDYSYTNKTYVLPGGRICRFTPSIMIETAHGQGSQAIRRQAGQRS